MKIKGKNNKTVILLLLVTSVVWGAILFNIVKYYKSRNSEESSEVVPSSENDDAKNIKGNQSRIEASAGVSYEALEHDPFKMEQSGASEENSPAKKPVHAEENIIPVKPRLNYKVSGVIINEGNKLVVFEDNSEGKTIFLREGDTYKDVTVKSVLMDKVTLTEDGKTKEIMLQK